MMLGPLLQNHPASLNMLCSLTVQGDRNHIILAVLLSATMAAFGIALCMAFIVIPRRRSKAWHVQRARAGSMSLEVISEPQGVENPAYENDTSRAFHQIRLTSSAPVGLSSETNLDSVISFSLANADQHEDDEDSIKTDLAQDAKPKEVC